MPQSILTADLKNGFDLELPLHPATDTAEDVARLLDRLLTLVDDFCVGSNASDADVVQALTLATALRTAMAEVSGTAGAAVPTRVLDVEVRDAAAQDG